VRRRRRRRGARHHRRASWPLTHLPGCHVSLPRLRPAASPRARPEAGTSTRHTDEQQVADPVAATRPDARAAPPAPPSSGARRGLPPPPGPPCLVAACRGPSAPSACLRSCWPRLDRTQAVWHTRCWYVGGGAPTRCCYVGGGAPTRCWYVGGGAPPATCLPACLLLQHKPACLHHASASHLPA